jgi:hypothetical protein
MAVVRRAASGFDETAPRLGNAELSRAARRTGAFSGAHKGS